jgi:hypothetical protein
MLPDRGSLLTAWSKYSSLTQLLRKELFEKIRMAGTTHATPSGVSSRLKRRSVPGHQLFLLSISNPPPPVGGWRSKQKIIFV